MSKDRLMIIDGSSLIYRAFYALPLLMTKGGIFTGGVYGFLSMLYRIREEYSPDYICVAFDRSGPTIRHDQFKEYKGTREKTPSELSQQFPIIKDILKNMGLKTLDMDKYEADDIAGTFAKKGSDEGYEVLLVTADKDYLQLAEKHVKVILTKKGISEIETYNKQRIIDEYEIEPLEFIDVKGLMGDKSDNIPGIAGIGEKTALKLIRQYGSLEGVYENLESITGKLHDRLEDNKQIAFLSRKLGEIITNVPLHLEIKDLKPEEQNFGELAKIYEKLEFRSLKSKLPNTAKDLVDVNSYKNGIISISNLSQWDRLIEDIKKEGKFAFKFISREDYIEQNPIGLGIKVPNFEIYWCDINEIDFVQMENLKKLFQSEEIEKISWDVKSDIVEIIKMGWLINNLQFDASIAEYIINPSQSNLSINSLSEEYFENYGPDIEALLGKGKKRKKYEELSKDELMNYTAFILETVVKLEPIMINIIKDRNMDELFNEIEMPLVEVLAHMEYSGVLVDKNKLDELGIEFEDEINKLIGQIYELANEEFNINSPKQLGEILFDRLELPVVKKTKTGYSTDVEVLESLKDKHPIIEKVLRYRQIVKLKSTYIDGLNTMISKRTGRIHSKFNQTITSTGRISSTDPNLQNIPIRSEDGRRIRKAFIAQSPDYRFLDGDYSQIELRILAHISDDPKMKEAFIKDEDIHTKTASEVFEVPLDEVTLDLRYKAKAINFSIVYGISDFSLSKDIGISRKEARKYIDGYFNNYKLVKIYMDEAISKGKEDGYVETLLNRRRYIPELESKNYNIRSFGERVAMNMPIQGSAADIIKMAMVCIYKKLKEEKLLSKIVLTIHDELIIEAHKDEIEYVKKMMKTTMEEVISLRVPLKVEIIEGDSWYDTK
ncbi:MAG: DNA polymerase I [Gudongella sp.]|nr:DNA polymerase I [Gudongella sp.]